MVFFVVDSSTGDLAHTGSATRRHFRPSRPLSQLLKHALALLVGAACLAATMNSAGSETSGNGGSAKS